MCAVRGHEKKGFTHGQQESELFAFAPDVRTRVQQLAVLLITGKVQLTHPFGDHLAQQCIVLLAHQQTNTAGNQLSGSLEECICCRWIFHGDAIMDKVRLDVKFLFNSQS